MPKGIAISSLASPRASVVHYNRSCVTVAEERNVVTTTIPMFTDRAKQHQSQLSL